MEVSSDSSSLAGGRGQLARGEGGDLRVCMYVCIYVFVYEEVNCQRDKVEIVYVYVYMTTGYVCMYMYI